MCHNSRTDDGYNLSQLDEIQNQQQPGLNRIDCIPGPTKLATRHLVASGSAIMRIPKPASHAHTHKHTHIHLVPILVLSRWCQWLELNSCS